MSQNTKTREAYYGRKTDVLIEWIDLENAFAIGSAIANEMHKLTRVAMATIDAHNRRRRQATQLAKRAIAEQWQPDYTVTNTPPPLPNWRIQCRKQPNGRWHIRWPQGQLIADAAEFDGALAIIRTIHERSPR